MSRISKKLPKDTNQRAFEIVRMSTEEPEPEEPKPERSSISEYLAEIGRKGGLKRGGHARKASLSDERRKEIARKAAKARWKKSTNTAE